MSAPVDVLAVMDTLMRGTALHADNCVGLLGKQWSHQALKAGPEARAAVAELIVKAENAEKIIRSAVVAGEIHTAYEHHADDLRDAIVNAGGAA